MSLFSNLGNVLRRTFGRLLEERTEPETAEVLETLRQMRVFQPLTRRQMRHLAAAVHRRHYARDEVIYYEGDPGLGFYVVQRGHVRLLVDDGGPSELRHVGEHQLFGDLSLYGEARRLETAQAVTDTHLLGFFRPDLRGLVKRHPRAGAAVVTALAHHLAQRHVDLLGRLAEKEGKLQALQALEETGS